MDELTNTNERLLYARVLLEIDASKEFVCTIQMNLPVRKLRIQHVVYEYEPKFCENCFGWKTNSGYWGHVLCMPTRLNRLQKIARFRYKLLDSMRGMDWVRTDSLGVTSKTTSNEKLKVKLEEQRKVIAAKDKQQWQIQLVAALAGFVGTSSAAPAIMNR
ncbi:Hypothetical predicted protein [Olea europaea subsp. europaea]|uniref:Uncharacterized protein n=1 Tax=Olea europaea subsp. europaea TaxID=158383 RepID=A0A8S0SU37_OLEEU|nr:Hypothetical predicted protein [Olea europaea subsp. europaea]